MTRRCLARSSVDRRGWRGGYDDDEIHCAVPAMWTGAAMRKDRARARRENLPHLGSNDLALMESSHEADD